MEEQLDMVEEVYQLIVNFLVNYSFQLLGAVLVLALGFIVGGWISRAVLRLMEHRNVDVTLREFLAGVVKMIVVGVFLLAVLGYALGTYGAWLCALMMQAVAP